MFYDQGAMHMINLASPDINAGDIKKVIAVLKSGALVQGENVALFENELCGFTDLPYCSVVTSGTAALHVALLALNLPVGSSVIVPAFTFPATANVVEITGGKTILCDVDPKTYVVTLENIEKVIIANRDKNIQAIIVVHEFGQPARIKEIAKIAKKYNLKLIEDAACALGTMADGHHVGFYGDLACFSFHPRKAITTGEGGAVMTRSKALDEKIKKLRNHGMEKNKEKIDFTLAGLNYRLTEFQAVLGREQLKRFNRELTKRKHLAKIYLDVFKDQPNLTMPISTADNSWQSFMVVLEDSIDRKKVIQKMAKAGIQTNLGAQALNCLSYFQKKYQVKDTDFPVATKLFQTGLALPLYGKLSPKTIKKIAVSLKENIK